MVPGAYSYKMIHVPFFLESKSSRQIRPIFQQLLWHARHCFNAL